MSRDTGRLLSFSDLTPDVAIATHNDPKGPISSVQGDKAAYYSVGRANTFLAVLALTGPAAKDPATPQHSFKMLFGHYGDGKRR